MSGVSVAGPPRASLTRQASWLLIAKTAGFALTFVLPLLLVRTLSRHDFGLYKQAFLIVTTAISILPLGFGMTAFYFLPREPARRGSVVLHVLAVHVAVGLAAAGLFALFPDAIARAFGSPELGGFSALLGGVILTWTIASFLEIIPIARGDVRASTIFIVTSHASKGVLFVLAALLAGSVESLIYAALVQGIAQTGVLLVYLHQAFPGYWRAFDWSFLRRQTSYALPLGVSALLFRFQLDLPHYFIAHHFGASVYAVYAIGAASVPLIGLLRDSVASVMLSRVSELEHAKDTREIVGLLARAARKLALLYFPVSACLLVLGRDYIAFLFTPRYLDAWPIFAIYLTLLPLGVLVFDPVTRAYEAQRYFVLRLRITILAATALVLWLSGPRLGPVGVVTLVVALQLAGIAASVLKLARVMGVDRQQLRLFSGLGRIALAAAGAAVACALVRHLLESAAPVTLLAACGAVYVAAYAALLLALDGVGPEEWALLRRALPARLRPAAS